MWGRRFICLVFLIIVIVAVISVARDIHRYFLLKPLALNALYGRGTWAVITGASSGQGKHFARGLAKRGFNVLLLGSPFIEQVAEDIRSQYDVQAETIQMNFALAFADDDFFNPIEKWLQMEGHQVSLLVNNVGQRSGWNPSHQQPIESIKATISTGTIVQARLIQLLMPAMLERFRQHGFRSGVICMTAQCMHSVWGPARLMLDQEISVPYMGVYEATNAWGFYHAQSLAKEYTKERGIDFLNVMPGAVLTENTRPFLTDTWFAIEADLFVDNVLTQLGHVHGKTYGYWGHALSGQLINLAPWQKAAALEKVGSDIADYFQHKWEQRALHKFSLLMPQS